MNEQKLMVCIGKDKNNNPIYKRVKTLIVQFIDKNNIIHMEKSKPFFTGHWMIKAHDRLFLIADKSIFFDKKNNFYVLIKQ